MRWLVHPRVRDVVVADQPDETLQHGVAVLRRRFARPALVRLRAEAHGERATRLRVESDALVWVPVFRRFRGDLLRIERGE